MATQFITNDTLMSGTSATSYPAGSVVYKTAGSFKLVPGSSTVADGVTYGSWVGGEYADILAQGEVLCPASGSVSAGDFLMASADGDGKVALLSGSAPTVGQAFSDAVGGFVKVFVGINPRVS